MRRLLRSVSILLVVMLIFCNLGVYIVHAEDTEDLFKIYGLELGGVSETEARSELEQVESELHQAEEQAQIAGWVNSSIEAAKLLYEERRKDVYARVGVIMESNVNVKNTLDEGIYGDIDTLLNADSVYKSNLKKMNAVLSELDGYSTISYMDSADVDIDEIARRYDSVYSKYQESISVFELGDVTNVKVPLNRAYYVTSEFGTRIDPLNPTTTRFHSGLDLRAEVGTEVYAMFNGVVSGCGWSDTCGYWVRITHGDNIRTFYCHLSEIKVVEGQEVSQYDLIALSGSTGSRCTGPHLHLGVYINGNAVNPVYLFR